MTGRSDASASPARQNTFQPSYRRVTKTETFLFPDMKLIFTLRLLKPGPPRQCKPITGQNWNKRFQHFQIQPIKCRVQNNEISTCLLTGDEYATTASVSHAEVCSTRKIIYVWTVRWRLKKKRAPPKKVCTVTVCVSKVYDLNSDFCLPS